MSDEVEVRTLLARLGAALVAAGQPVNEVEADLQHTYQPIRHLLSLLALAACADSNGAINAEAERVIPIAVASAQSGPAAPPWAGASSCSRRPWWRGCRC